MGKILPLESLRGVAALSVVAYHFRIDSSFNNAFTENGWLMVDFFFVLSGFVIALNYTDRLSNFEDLRQFFLKRFWRLYPLHFAMLIAFLCVEFLKYFAVNRLGIGLAETPFTTNNAESFFANLLLLQNIIIHDTTFNKPSWSISAEFYTYLLFAFAVTLSRGRRVLLLLVALVSLLAGVGIFFLGVGVQPDNVAGPLRCIYGFCIGIIGFMLYRLVQTEVQTSLPALLLLFLTVFVVMIAPSGFLAFITPVFGLTVIVVAVTSSETLISKALSNRMLVFLGTISYGVYMIHWLVVSGATLMLRPAFGVPVEHAPGLFRLDFGSTLLADLVMLITVLFVIALSTVSYFCFERPIVRRVRSQSKMQ